MKRSGLKNQPHQTRNCGKRKSLCGRRVPGWGFSELLCVLARDHKGHCMGPIKRAT